MKAQFPHTAISLRPPLKRRSIGKMRAALIFALAFAIPASHAALPPDAQRVLNNLPGKAVTLDVVWARAMQTSDSFEQVASQKALEGVGSLGARAATDPRLTLQYNWTDNRHEVSNSFSPSNLKNSSYSLGLTTLLPTGTGVAVDLNTASNSLSVAGLSPNYFESKLTLSLTQNLWQDFFGQATRAQIRAGEWRDKSIRAGLEMSVEQWSTSIQNVFYDAWLAKMRAAAMTENTQRRTRLERIVRIKTQRGTSETPDLLQARSALLAAKVQEAEAGQALKDRWQGLVITLKLPRSWLEIDPREIPIVLDNPIADADAKCESQSAKPPRYSETEMAQADAKAAAAKYEAAKSMTRPDLELRLSAASNGVDAGSRSPTLDEVRDYKHPAYYLGVQLSLPLLSRAEEANYRSALAEKIQTEAGARMAESNLQLNWLSSCSALKRWQEALAQLKEARENQIQRAKLDERRFEIGRTPIFSVVQAGDDATLADLNFRAGEVQARMAAWKVLRLHDGFSTQIRRMSELKTEFFH